MRPFNQIPPLRRAICAVALGLACVAARPCPAARKPPEAESRLGLSWEYDDNVLDDRADRISGGAGTVSLFSKVRFYAPRTVSNLNLNLGYKGHHRLSDSDSLTAGDILVQRLTLDTERLLSPAWSAGAGAELKVRNIYRKNELNLLAEEGYTRGAGSLFLRRNLQRAGRLTLSYQYSFYNFATFHTFDYRAHSPRLQLAGRLSPSLNGFIQYSFTNRGYDRPVNVPAPGGSLAQIPSRQRDRLHELDLSLSFSRARLLNFIYALQRNDSNSYGYSYWNNRFTLLYADKLPGRLFVNAYLFFEIKRYSDVVTQPVLVDIITEDNNNNGAIIKLSRPLTESLDASFTFSFYRNESSIRDLNFRKNLIDSGLTYRF